MKMIFLRNAWFFFLNHGRKCCLRNSTYIMEVIFTPSGILKGPTISLPMIPAQNITPPPPCWCRSLVCMGCPSTSRPPLHPSGPSSVARHSSVNETVLKSCIVLYCLAHWSRFCLCAVDRGGRQDGLHSCKPLKDPASCCSGDVGGTSSFKNVSAAMIRHFCSCSFNLMSLPVGKSPQFSLISTHTCVL